MTMTMTKNRAARKTRVSLWVVQGMLALLFLFAGTVKLAMPAQALAAQTPLPVDFLRFIGVCETLGALGLILPGALRIWTVLTPIAASGLVIIMIGATALSPGAAAAAFPAAVGSLAAFVVYGRLRLAPFGARPVDAHVTTTVRRAA
jgi:hypothetical protein